MPGKDAGKKDKKHNLMREIRIDKLVLNCCVGKYFVWHLWNFDVSISYDTFNNLSIGESGDRLTRASKVMKDLTGQEPVVSSARYTIRTFGIRRRENIACHCTVRGQKAE